MNIYLFNDTSGTHSGCDRIIDNILYYLKNHSILAKHRTHDFCYDEEAFNKSDIIIVNGEGTLHHNQETAKFLMNILKMAQLHNKKTVLINTLLQDMSFVYNDIFKKLNYFSVRDPYSQIQASEYGCISYLFADLCINRIEDTKGEIIQKLPEIVCGDTHPDILYNLLSELPYCRFYLNNKFEDVIETLKQCEIYITGQYHGIYASAIADISFIPLVSNSYKIESLIGWSRLPIKVCYNLEDVYNQMRLVKTNKNLYHEFHDFIMKLPRMRMTDWQTFLE